MLSLVSKLFGGGCEKLGGLKNNDSSKQISIQKIPDFYCVILASESIKKPISRGRFELLGMRS